MVPLGVKERGEQEGSESIKLHETTGSKVANFLRDLTGIEPHKSVFKVNSKDLEKLATTEHKKTTRTVGDRSSTREKVSSAFKVVRDVLLPFGITSVATYAAVNYAIQQGISAATGYVANTLVGRAINGTINLTVSHVLNATAQHVTNTAASALPTTTLEVAIVTGVIVTAINLVVRYGLDRWRLNRAMKKASEDKE